PLVACVMTPPPVGLEGSLPVEVLRFDFLTPAGLSSMSTELAQSSMSLAMALLGSGVGIGPAGDGGGHRQVSGNAAIDFPQLPLCSTLRLLANTLSDMIAPTQADCPTQASFGAADIQADRRARRRPEAHAKRQIRHRQRPQRRAHLAHML